MIHDDDVLPLLGMALFYVLCLVGFGLMWLTFEP